MENTTAKQQDRIKSHSEISSLFCKEIFVCYDVGKPMKKSYLVDNVAHFRREIANYDYILS